MHANCDKPCLTCSHYTPINVMPHPTPLGQGVGEIGALVGLLIQRWSPGVGPNVYGEKVVTAHAQNIKLPING